VHSNGSLIPVEGVFLNLSDDPSVRGIVLTIRDARLGGDEFAVLVESIGDRADVDAVALRIHTALDEPFSIQGEEIFVHASVGIASNADGGGCGCEELLRNADMAMYAAKASGKGRSELFRPTMHLAARKRLQLKSDLRRAVEAGDLHVQYQPLVDLDDQRIVGAEALVRWSHPELGDIPPIDFIPLAEETGLIVPLGRQVLNAACLEARAWKDQLPEGESLYVSVNLSVRQFRPAGQIAQHVREATAAAGKGDAALVRSVVELGQALDMEISAEGIEHRGQLDSLHDLHCTVGQGFLFARPLDGAEVTELVRARSRQVA